MTAAAGAQAYGAGQYDPGYRPAPPANEAPPPPPPGYDQAYADQAPSGYQAGQTPPPPPGYRV